MSDLDEYLKAFLRRQRPLVQLEHRIGQVNDQFESLMGDRKVPGWEQRTHELPMYVGVTDRLFSNENVMKSHMNSKAFIKCATANPSTADDANSCVKLSEERDKVLALLEFRISELTNMLSETINDTIDMVTRKQARTSREITRELNAMHDGLVAELPAEPESDTDSTSSEGEVMDVGDRAIFNPKKLPVGWDGKPIPYWIYKLHGLGHEFKCEICGNHSYWGRRAFDQHFGEMRHVNGLRSLRIPNSVHFHGVTRIEDAVILHDKLRNETTSAIFNADKEMECEDAMGNIMSYRAYQDLSRQGLL